MNISDVSQSYRVQATTMLREYSTSTSRVDTATNEINISNAAREAANNDKTSALDDLKLHQVAPWMADYMMSVSTELGGKGGVEFGSRVVGNSDYEKNQYAGLAQKEYQAVLEEENFNTIEEYNNALIVDKDYSVKLQERFMERMTEINQQLYSKLG